MLRSTALNGIFISAKRYKKSDILCVLVFFNLLNLFFILFFELRWKQRLGLLLHFLPYKKLLTLQIFVFDWRKNEVRQPFVYYNFKLTLLVIRFLEFIITWRERRNGSRIGQAWYIRRERAGAIHAAVPSMDAHKVICSAGNRKSWTVKASRNVGSAQSLHCLGILDRWNEMNQVTNRRDQLPPFREEKDANEGLPPRVRTYTYLPRLF